MGAPTRRGFVAAVITAPLSCTTGSIERSPVSAMGRRIAREIERMTAERAALDAQHAQSRAKYVEMLADVDEIARRVATLGPAARGA